MHFKAIVIYYADLIMIVFNKKCKILIENILNCFKFNNTHLHTINFS